MRSPPDDVADRRVEVRRAGRDDLASLLALVAEYCAVDGHDFDPDLARSGLVPLLADDSRGVVWLVVVRADGQRTDDDVDGYAIVTWGWSIEVGGFEVVLDELYVRTRGVGHGSAVLEAVEADCRLRGVRRIVLETERPNEAARRLYRRHGYADDDSVWMAKLLT